MTRSEWGDLTLPTTLSRIDPGTCGCTDCLTGYSKPLAYATDDELNQMFRGELADATGVAWGPIHMRIVQAARDARRQAINEILAAGAR